MAHFLLLLGIQPKDWSRASFIFPPSVGHKPRKAPTRNRILGKAIKPARQNAMRLGDNLKKRGKLTRQMLFSRLPHRVHLEGEAGGLPGRHECQLLLAKEPFLTLTGLELGEKPFVLPLGTKLTIGVGLEEGWGEFECEVVGWSAGKEGYQVMLRCPLEGGLYQRRRYPRYSIRRTIALDGPPRQEGETENLSQSGLCVDFPDSLPENHNLTFELSSENASQITLEGRVVWQQAAADTGGFLAGIRLVPNPEWSTILGRGSGRIAPRLVSGGN
jgi:hypothetical protein